MAHFEIIQLLIFSYVFRDYVAEHLVKSCTFLYVLLPFTFCSRPLPRHNQVDAFSSLLLPGYNIQQLRRAYSYRSLLTYYDTRYKLVLHRPAYTCTGLGDFSG